MTGKRFLPLCHCCILTENFRHNDLPWNIRQFIHNKLEKVNLSINIQYSPPWSTSKWSHTDFLRLRKGRVGAQLWTAYAPCGSQHKDAVQITLEQIDLIKRLVDQYSDHLQLALSAQGKAKHPVPCGNLSLLYPRF